MFFLKELGVVEVCLAQRILKAAKSKSRRTKKTVPCECQTEQTMWVISFVNPPFFIFGMCVSLFRCGFLLGLYLVVYRIKFDEFFKRYFNYRINASAAEYFSKYTAHSENASAKTRKTPQDCQNDCEWMERKINKKNIANMFFLCRCLLFSSTFLSFSFCQKFTHEKNK